MSGRQAGCGLFRHGSIVPAIGFARCSGDRPLTAQMRALPCCALISRRRCLRAAATKPARSGDPYTTPWRPDVDAGWCWRRASPDVGSGAPLRMEPLVHAGSPRLEPRPDPRGVQASAAPGAAADLQRRLVCCGRQRVRRHHPGADLGIAMQRSGARCSAMGKLAAGQRVLVRFVLQGLSSGAVHAVWPWACQRRGFVPVGALPLCRSL